MRFRHHALLPQSSLTISAERPARFQLRPKPRKRDLSARETMTSGPIQYSLLRMTTFSPLSLPRHRRDGAAAVFLDADDARFALRLVADRHLMHAEELPDQDRQQMRGAADAAGEDAGQALHRLDRRLVVDEQRRGPVAARHDAGQVHHQPDIDAGQDRSCRNGPRRCARRPRSGSAPRSADDRRARARRGRTPCNCTTAPSRLSGSSFRSTFHSRFFLKS